MALILSDYRGQAKSWDDVFKTYNGELKWSKLASEKQAKIEDEDELWQTIKDEIGEEEAAVIIPLCKGNVDEAKKEADKLEGK